MESYKRLILANKAWAKDKTERYPEYFQQLSIDQRPEFLWIGCSDSRVPAEEVTGTQPGEVFVHRNIANLVIHTDFNLLSVLQYAVDYLMVKHIIVCGHYGCGGIKAALSRQKFGLLNKWLRHIKDIYVNHKNEFSRGFNEEERTNKMVELNVQQQIQNLAKTSIIQRAWHAEKRPTLHGWVFDLKTGLLKTVCQMEPGTPIDEIFQYEF
jgi:carbonic anhydrase